MKRAAKDSLAALIVDDMNLVLDGAEFNNIYKRTISYIVGQDAAFAHQAFLKQFCGKHLRHSAKNLRLRVLHSNHLFTIKMFTMKLSMLRSVSESDIITVASEFKVRMSDARRIHAILLDDPKFKLGIRGIVKELPHQSTQLSMEYTSKLFSDIFKGVHVYIKSLVYRKLRFVAKSQNLGLEDLQGEVLLKVVQAYYKVVPTTMSDDHIANYLRRAAHNHIMNMISSATTQKRGRLVNAGLDRNKERTFSMIVLSENQLNVNSLDGEEINYDELGADQQHEAERLDLKISVAQLLDQSRADRKKFKMLTILMGSYSKQFTLFLRQSKLCSISETNVEVQLRIPADTYIQLVGQHLKLNSVNLKAIVNDVKVSLGSEESHHEKQRAA